MEENVYWAKDWERSVRLTSLGYDLDKMEDQMHENLFSDHFLYEWNTHLPYRPKKFPLEYELKRLQFTVEHSYDTATVLIDTLLLILIEIIEIVTQVPDVMLLSPDLRDAARNIEQYRADYHFLSSNGIRTVAELSENIADTKAQISSLEAERSTADNARRRTHTPEERQAAKERRKAITKEISPLREQLKRAEKIMEESPHLYELLQQEHGLERAAMRKLERSR